MSEAFGERELAMFVIEDEIHCDWHGEFATLSDAIRELRRWAGLRWNELPNAAPCMSSETCGRKYVIIEFDDAQSPWKELRRISAFEVSAAGVEWSSELIGPGCARP
ncbi:MAG: hypothetical protein ACJ8C4_01210 [Gemmataceae bacterium]